eukprot:3849283-Rhodomonas_salina.1
MTTICGRARLGGIPVGVVMPEMRTVRARLSQSRIRRRCLVRGGDGVCSDTRWRSTAGVQDAPGGPGGPGLNGDDGVSGQLSSLGSGPVGVFGVWLSAAEGCGGRLGKCGFPTRRTRRPRPLRT